MTSHACLWTFEDSRNRLDKALKDVGYDTDESRPPGMPTGVDPSGPALQVHPARQGLPRGSEVKSPSHLSHPFPRPSVPGLSQKLKTGNLLRVNNGYLWVEEL